MLKSWQGLPPTSKSKSGTIDQSIFVTIFFFYQIVTGVSTLNGLTEHSEHEKQVCSRPRRLSRYSHLDEIPTKVKEKDNTGDDIILHNIFSELYTKLP